MIAAALRWLHRIENGFLVGLVVLALGLAAAQIVLRNSGGTALVWADQALNILVLWIALALTVISMVVYFQQNWKIIREVDNA